MKTASISVANFINGFLQASLLHSRLILVMRSRVDSFPLRNTWRRSWSHMASGRFLPILRTRQPHRNRPNGLVAVKIRLDPACRVNSSRTRSLAGVAVDLNSWTANRVRISWRVSTNQSPLLRVIPHDVEQLPMMQKVL